jgi:hypothetical protein
MMAFFGETSAADITLDGVHYTLATRFWTPSTQAGALGLAPEPVPFCSGVIETVTSLGGGLYRLRMQRAPQTFFYVIPPQAPGQGSTEVPYSCTMGGNVCQPAEWMRGWSHLNQGQAVRGSMEAVRAFPGCGGVLRERNTLPAKVTRAEAHAIAPAAVNYAGNAPLPQLRYKTIELYDIRATRRGPTVPWFNSTGVDVEEGAIVITSLWSATALAAIPASSTGNVAVDLDGEIVFDGNTAGTYPSGLVIYDGSTPTVANRVIFAPLGGDPEPTYLPDDLGASGFTGTDYWWDPASRSVRLSSYCILEGDEADLVWWVKTARNVPAEPAGTQMIVEAGPGAGPGTSADNCAASMFDVAGEGTWVFNIFAGVGFAEWRRDGRINAQRATMMLGATGPTAVTRRASHGVAAGVITMGSTPTYSYPYQVRIVRSTDEVQFSARQSGGDSWTALATCEMTGVVEETDGLVGLGSFDEDTIRFNYSASETLDRLLILLGVSGTHAVLRSTGKLPFVVAQNLGLTATGVTSVQNLTTGETMTAGSGVRRDQYRILEGNLAAVAENSGDRWLITYAPSGSPPAAPGRAPRPVTGQIDRGWVELQSDPNPDFLPSTNVANNRANWHDLIEMQFEDGTIPQVGETVDFIAWGVFDPSDPPTFRWSARNAEEDAWNTFTTGQFRAFYWAGLVLHTEAWVNANAPSGVRPCLRAEGKVILTSQMGDAARHTELRDGVQVLEDLWQDIRRGGYDATVVGGTLIRTIGPTAKDESDRVTAVGVGLLNTQYDAAAWSAPPPGLTPYWAHVPGLATTAFFDSILRSGYVWDPGDPDGDLMPFTGDAALFVFPYSGSWPLTGDVDNYAGMKLPSSPEPLSVRVGCDFKIQGVPFDPTGALAKLPGDAVITGAWLECTFANLEQQNWTATEILGPGLESSLTVTWNGELQTERIVDSDGYTVVNYLDTELPQLQAGASVSFDLVGKILKSENVVDWTGATLEVKRHEYVTFASGLTGATRVEDGQPTLVDITAAMQAFVANRDSLIALDTVELWPSFGVAINSDVEGLGGYLRGLAPQVTYSVGGDIDDRVYTLAMSGRWVQFDSIQIGKLLIQYRTGINAGLVRPIIAPPAV